ncbi:uncharacterized protein DUF4123 [Enterobacter sp. BIGb0383]|uniref:DUF4123 domain-containing protein n=1 Tax=unclassified Enterobacter TaxID=2608935 RepID=UPI000F47550C|nr:MULTISPECIES: DUF4123 domain-containing protein [unclassified Enterobacter]ROP58142.1 uncharacterized protein DUF4123 [Enterobacter sp. BIGb0383]ROS00791.1 uncharacterized protein DUF4123 [Enterobacter sp. BIGb0359]
MSFCQHLEKLGLPVNHPHIRVYILTEAAADPAMLARMEFHDTGHRPIWRLDKLAGMEKYSPWLCEITRDGEFDQWLEKVADKAPLTVLFSRMPSDELWQHLRLNSKFAEDGRRFFLRMGDPSALHLYTASLAYQPSSVRHLFADGQIEELYFHHPRAELACRAQPLFEQHLDSTAECEGCLVWIDVPTEESA